MKYYNTLKALAIVDVLAWTWALYEICKIGG
jgi:hypothetical protein